MILLILEISSVSNMKNKLAKNIIVINWKLYTILLTGSFATHVCVTDGFASRAPGPNTTACLQAILPMFQITFFSHKNRG